MVAPTILLSVRFPEGLEVLGLPPQTMLENALIKSQISPNRDEMKAAFKGGAAHYFHKDDPQQLIFSATRDLVEELLGRPGQAEQRQKQYQQEIATAGGAEIMFTVFLS